MAKVLLVEDDNNLREIYQARMQAEGYDVIAAKDGEEALVVAKAERPELIISDVMMPKISGFEMLDIIRNTDGLKDVKVIMLTALGQTDDQQRADRLGADRYLVKSQVTLEDIVNVTHQLLGDVPEPEVAPAATIAVPAPLAVEPAADAAVPAAVPPVAAPTEVVATAASVTPVASAVTVTPPVAETAAVLVPTTPSTTPVNPVAITPAPEPETATEPPATYSAVQVDPPIQSAVQQTSAQEEAVVEAQIEDFVSGASTDPNGSSSTETASDAVIDDKLTADALQSIGGTDTNSPEPEPTPAVEPEPAPVADTVPAPAPAAPAPQPDTPAPVPVPVPVPADPSGIPAQPPAPAPAAVLQTVAPVSMIAGKKIITPIDSAQSKPDINALLAQEEAKDILAANGGVPAPPPTLPASATVMDTGGTVHPDPNSIAL